MEKFLRSIANHYRKEHDRTEKCLADITDILARKPPEPTMLAEIMNRDPVNGKLDRAHFDEETSDLILDRLVKHYERNDA